MKQFIQAHKHLLDTMRLPWYIPEWLGGVGLPIGEWGGPSDLDLRIARALLNNWSTERPTSLAHKETSWQTWRLAESRMPKAFFTETENALTALYSRVMTLQCVNLLFDSHVSLRELMVTVQGGRTAQAIKRNAKLWSPKRWTNCLPQPLKVEDLKFVARFPALPPELVRVQPGEHKVEGEHRYVLPGRFVIEKIESERPGLGSTRVHVGSLFKQQQLKQGVQIEGHLD